MVKNCWKGTKEYLNSRIEPMPNVSLIFKNLCNNIRDSEIFLKFSNNLSFLFQELRAETISSIKMGLHSNRPDSESELRIVPEQSRFRPRKQQQQQCKEPRFFQQSVFFYFWFWEFFKKVATIFGRSQLGSSNFGNVFAGHDQVRIKI
jgi:hypothetical protein